MAYKHGVYASEIATSILPPRTVDAGIPFVVGTAPVGMADPENVNKPVLCHTYSDFVKAFGWVPPEVDEASGKKKFQYSLCEAAYAAFVLYGIAPIVCVNVLDPDTHRTAAETTVLNIPASAGSITVPESGVIPSTVTITLTTTTEPEEGSEEEPVTTVTTYEEGTHYELAFDDDAHLVVNVLHDAASGDPLMPLGTELGFSAYVTDPGEVDGDDVIGGVDSGGAKSGLELVEEMYPRFGLVPGTIIAPGFSEAPGVAAVMSAKTTGVNGLFGCVCACDVPTAASGGADQYSEVNLWKNQNNYVHPRQIVCWPMVELDGVVMHMSSHVAARMAATDADNGGIPYVSPSNKSFEMTAAVLENGEEVWLSGETANYLNGQGIVTALNFEGGWRCWGNRTGAYPSVTDPKDAFIPVRRMFNWLGNTLILTYWQRVDFPLNKRQIQTVVDSANIWLNGLAARQCILGGRVEFLESENPVTSLEDGIATFHVYVTPPVPNRDLEFVLEYDVNYFSTLFE